MHISGPWKFPYGMYQLRVNIKTNYSVMDGTKIQWKYDGTRQLQQCTLCMKKKIRLVVWLLFFNATFSNIGFNRGGHFLLLENAGVPGENDWLPAIKLAILGKRFESQLVSTKIQTTNIPSVTRIILIRNKYS